MRQKSLTIISALLISLTLILTNHALAFAYDCGQFTEAVDCEGRTGRGCEWNQGQCVFNQNNITNPPAQGAASDSFGTIDPLAGKFDTPSSIINELLPFLLTGAGIILFGMLIMGGFTMMTAVSDPKKAEAGKARITAALIGFVIIFASYWIVQLLEVIFGVTILK